MSKDLNFIIGDSDKLINAYIKRKSNKARVALYLESSQYRVLCCFWITKLVRTDTIECSFPFLYVRERTLPYVGAFQRCTYHCAGVFT